DSLQTYVDPDNGYSLLAPQLWPLTDRAGDGSTTTFIEIGERGYLTVFSQDGARGFTARDIISAWKNEWAKQEGFRLIADIHDVEVAGKQGVRLEYSWIGD